VCLSTFSDVEVAEWLLTYSQTGAEASAAAKPSSQSSPSIDTSTGKRGAIEEIAAKLGSFSTDWVMTSAPVDCRNAFPALWGRVLRGSP